MQIILAGIGCLILGTITLTRYKSFAKKMANQMKTSSFAKLTRFDYSEKYYCSLYKFVGIFLIAMSVLVFLSVLLGGKEHSSEGVGNYIFLGLVITMMASGFLYIIYVAYKFGNKK